MSPFSAMFFVGTGEMRRQIGPQQDHCSPPQASSLFHVVFVVLPPSFVSPKLQVFNQRLIQNFLWICPWTQYRTTPISHATQSTVRQNCPLCRRCFRNIPLQNTLPTIALQLTALLSFRNRRLCAVSSSFSFSLSKTFRSLIPYLRLSDTFFSTLKVANVSDNTSAFFLAAAAIPHSTLG